MNNQPPSKPFSEWLGRTTEANDIVSQRLVESFRAVFDPCLADGERGAAPLGVHWCLSPAIVPMSLLGDDGHPARNLSLPPIPQPRRMWAGGTLELLDDLRPGDRVRRASTIADINRKNGKSGELWFLAVDHEYSTGRGIALRERQDIVYREAARPGGSRAQVASAQMTAGSNACIWQIVPSPTLLFRYSAITFNGHRIHYDLPYATEVEGYEGLVVHGPLQATLLLNLAAVSLGRTPAFFSYRGLMPAFANRPLTVHQETGERSNIFWTESGGTRSMEAHL